MVYIYVQPYILGKQIFISLLPVYDKYGTNVGTDGSMQSASSPFLDPPLAWYLTGGSVPIRFARGTGALHRQTRP